MRHCCQFKADDIYYLYETAVYTTRKLSVGFCPICKKPIAELYKVLFSGTVEREYFIGISADNIIHKLKNEINYSASKSNLSKFKSKPYGWKYGENKSAVIKGKERIKQYGRYCFKII